MNIADIQWQCNKAIKYVKTTGFTHPEQILMRGTGDCTDFALLKLDMAIGQGMTGYLLRCWTQEKSEAHMLCVIEGSARAWIFGRKKPCLYVLDNRNDAHYVVFGEIKDDVSLRAQYFFGGIDSNTHTVEDLKKMKVLTS